MKTLRCTECRLPYLAGERADGACPSCGYVEPPPPAPEPVAIAPPPEPQARRWPWIVGAAVALTLAWWLGRATAPREEVVAVASPAAVPVGPDPALAKAVAELQEVRDALAMAETQSRDHDAARAEADKLRAGAEEKALAVQKERDALEARLATAERRLDDVFQRLVGRGAPAVAERVPFAAVRRDERPVEARPAAEEKVVPIDQPEGEHFVAALDRGQNVRLVGRVKTLVVEAVRGGASLDASELQARNVVFLGPISAGSRVALAARNGTVTVPEVSGGSRFDAIADVCKVTFEAVSGDAQINVRAREIEFLGAITGGGTRILATLTPGGRLTFRELSAGVLAWRKYRRSDDPAPTVEPGPIRDGARFVQADPALGR